MKLDAPITLLDGEPLERLTIGDVLTQAALNSLPGDEALTGQQKIRLFRIAMDMHEKTEITFPVEDVALLKERVGRMFAPLVVARAWAALDPGSI